MGVIRICFECWNGWGIFSFGSFLRKSSNSMHFYASNSSMLTTFHLQLSQPVMNCNMLLRCTCWDLSKLFCKQKQIRNIAFLRVATFFRSLKDARNLSLCIIHKTNNQFYYSKNSSFTFNYSSFDLWNYSRNYSSN